MKHAIKSDFISVGDGSHLLLRWFLDWRDFKIEAIAGRGRLQVLGDRG